MEKLISLIYGSLIISVLYVVIFILPQIIDKEIYRSEDSMNSEIIYLPDQIYKNYKEKKEIENIYKNEEIAVIKIEKKNIIETYNDESNTKAITHKCLNLWLNEVNFISSMFINDDNCKSEYITYKEIKNRILPKILNDRIDLINRKIELSGRKIITKEYETIIKNYEEEIDDISIMNY